MRTTETTRWWGAAAALLGLLWAAGASAQSAAELREDPVRLDGIVREALAPEPLVYTDVGAASSHAGPVVLAYVQAEAWDGFVALVRQGQAQAWTPAWKLRLPREAAGQASWLQVSSGWSLEDADGDGHVEGVYFGCLPHNCCGEFGLAVVQLGPVQGSLVHVGGEAGAGVLVRTASEQPPPAAVRPYLKRELFDRLCEPLKTASAREAIGRWLAELP